MLDLSRLGCGESNRRNNFDYLKKKRTAFTSQMARIFNQCFVCRIGLAVSHNSERRGTSAMLIMTSHERCKLIFAAAKSFANLSVFTATADAG